MGHAFRFRAPTAAWAGVRRLCLMRREDIAVAPRASRGVCLSEAIRPGGMPQRHDNEGDVNRYAP